MRSDPQQTEAAGAHGQGLSGVLPVAEDGPFRPWGCDRQLEGRVEVVLLLI